MLGLGACGLTTACCLLVGDLRSCYAAYFLAVSGDLQVGVPDIVIQLVGVVTWVVGEREQRRCGKGSALVLDIRS